MVAQNEGFYADSLLERLLSNRTCSFLFVLDTRNQACRLASRQIRDWTFTWWRIANFGISHGGQAEHAFEVATVPIIQKDRSRGRRTNFHSRID